MSDFWSKALGGGAPAPAPRQEPASRPWWDQSPIPTPQVAHTPGPQQVGYPEQPVQPLPTKAKSAFLTETCPDCGSGNYFKPQGVPNAMPVCYACGYNPRFAHSTAGAGMPSDKSAPVRASRQVSTANNYNPTTIIGKVE